MSSVPQYDSSVQVETEILGCLLDNPDLLPEISLKLPYDHFQDPTRRDLYRSMTRLSREGADIFANTILDDIRKHEGESSWTRVSEETNWISLSEASTQPSRIQHSVDKLIGLSSFHKLRRLGSSMVDLQCVPGETLEDHIAGVRETLDSIQYGCASSVQVEPVTKQLPGFMEDLYSGKGTVGIPSGFKTFDDLTNGLTPGVTILGGAPGAGKTSLSKQIADHVALSGTPVLFMALDEPIFEQHMKTLTRLQNVPKRRLGDLEYRDRVEQARRAYEEFAFRLYMLGRQHKDLLRKERLWALVERIKRDHDAERILIVVDYLQVFPVEERHSLTDKQKIDRVCESLLALSERTSSPVLALSSLNRTAYSTRGKDGKQERPQIGDMAGFKESGNIEFSGTVALQLWHDREGTERLPNHQDSRQVHRLIVHKSRASGKGEVPLIFYPVQYRFEEVRPEHNLRDWAPLERFS